MAKFWVSWVSAVMLGTLATAAHAQSDTLQGGVYTCVDAKGRKLTADRPIADCLDREQKVLNPSGTVRAKVGPNLTAKEKADLEEKEKQDALERARSQDEKRRDKALVTRYPNKSVHDQERADALGPDSGSDQGCHQPSRRTRQTKADH